MSPGWKPGMLAAAPHSQTFIEPVGLVVGFEPTTHRLQDDRSVNRATPAGHVVATLVKHAHLVAEVGFEPTT